MIKQYSTGIFLTVFLTFILFACSGTGKDKTRYVNLETSEGLIKLMLYNNTPLHRDNFIKLVNDGYYDNIKFHRVIEDFMIQAGDYTTRPDLASDTSGRYEYTIPAEIITANFHKRGALAAARTGDRFNPERKSSGTQFYIVQGRKFGVQITEEGDTITAEMMIEQVENRINSSLKQNIFYMHLQNERQKSKDSGDGRSDAEIQEAASISTYNDLENYKPVSIPDEHVRVYSSEGGTPHLDMQYTVFGEVVEGMDVVDRIAGVETDAGDRPLKDVIISRARVVRK
ncbi:MAG TPA: peptidylprolyl isomerase [Bacteroidetes bacterium]|nr:peptidylprolyl isomerase [Bacteroidota bacterium]